MADILIMNMKMPNCCGLCPCFHYEHPMYCQASKDVKIEAPYIYVAKGCPLVELPPHGTLKDTDFIIDCLEAIRKDYPEAYKLISGVIERTPVVLEASE